MTINELITEIESMGYVISGSTATGWMIRFDNGIEIRLPIGMDYQYAAAIANKL